MNSLMETMDNSLPAKFYGIYTGISGWKSKRATASKEGLVPS